MAWSTSNRSPLVRIPSSRGLSTRVEVRSVDPSANPYLALAVLLKAGLDGIEHKLTPPPPVDRNIYAMDREERLSEGITDLPPSLARALEELHSNEIIVASLGPHIYEHFVEAKEIEWDNFRSHVSEWERDHYMKMY